MNTKKRQRNLNIVLIILALLAIGMFGYANIYQPNFAEQGSVDLYVANQNIPAKVELEQEMFDVVRVNKDAYINGSVTDITKALGKQLNGSLNAGELLFEQRIESESHSDGSLVAELVIPTRIPLSHNDSIRVYAQYSDSKGVTIEELFHEKRVISRERLAATGKISGAIDQAISPTANEGNAIYVRLTDQEAMAYQKAVKTGDLFIVKIDQPEDESTLSTGLEMTDREPIEKEEDGEVESLASYQIQEGDTIESIAERFQTTVVKIIELNDGNSDFAINEIINVPGN